MCGICNVWVCLCVFLYYVVLYMCGFRDVWFCVGVGFVKCSCVDVWKFTFFLMYVYDVYFVISALCVCLGFVMCCCAYVLDFVMFGSMYVSVR